MPEYCNVKYMGGHIEYPKPCGCRLNFYNDRIELENPELTIPYQSITNIENADEKSISAFRVVMFGIIGALWKKKHLYTIIQYRDSLDERTIVVDFDDIVDVMQPFIYRRMIRYRRSASLKSENNFFIYENKDQGFRIKYPETWFEDELNQKNEGYTTIVEFRKCIEDMSPFVTVYVNNLNGKNMSSSNYINEGIKELEKDLTTSVLEQTEIVIGNNSGIKLVDVDRSGYKRMVFWIPSDDTVYEITYTSKQEQYLEDLPVVENMMNSFQILQKTAKQSDEKPKTRQTTDEPDPLVILKRRFAKGEITEEDYQRIFP
jgi:hypothetical protein